MDLKHYSDHCIDQNRQVIESEKSNFILKKNIVENPTESNIISNENSLLEARIQSLKRIVSLLKCELLEEKTLWKKELELMANLITSNDHFSEPDSNLKADVDTQSFINLLVYPPDSMTSSPLIRDYEEKINRYQGALAQAQAEKRYNIRRQIAANTYRKRLNEVEKLCQEELNKVRETATFLEPLKQIASEWSKSKQDNHLDFLKNLPGEKGKLKSAITRECSGDFLTSTKRETEIQEDYEIPIKQIDASLVVDEDVSSEIKGKIVFQIESLPSEVPTICYSAKFE